MTVEELIDALKRIEPKSRKVYLHYESIDDAIDDYISIDSLEIDSVGDVILDGEIS